MRITAQEAYRRGWPVIVKRATPILIPRQAVFPSPIVKKRRALNTRLAELLPVAALAANVSRAEILGTRRHNPIMAARKAIYLVMSREGYPSNRIGIAMNRDHSSVLSGVRSAELDIKRDPECLTAVVFDVLSRVP